MCQATSLLLIPMLAPLLLHSCLQHHVCEVVTDEQTHTHARTHVRTHRRPGLLETSMQCWPERNAWLTELRRPGVWQGMIGFPRQRFSQRALTVSKRGNIEYMCLHPMCQSPLGFAHSGLTASSLPDAALMQPDSSALTMTEVSMSPLPVQSMTSMICGGEEATVVGRPRGEPLSCQQGCQRLQGSAGAPTSSARARCSLAQPRNFRPVTHLWPTIRGDLQADSACVHACAQLAASQVQDTGWRQLTPACPSPAPPGLRRGAAPYFSSALSRPDLCRKWRRPRPCHHNQDAT